MKGLQVFTIADLTRVINFRTGYKSEKNPCISTDCKGFWFNSSLFL